MFLSTCYFMLVHEPEGQSVPSELNKFFCEDIHPNDTKKYDSSALKVVSSFFMNVSIKIL